MDINSVSILQADLTSIEHQKAVLKLTQAYASDPMGGGEALSAEVLDLLIPGLQATPHSLIFLAYLESFPIGIATCFRGFSTFLAKPLLNIHDIAVLPQYRGQGIGQKLIAAVEAKGIEIGCGKLTLEVQSKNLIAQQTYKRAGFNNDRNPQSTGRVFFLVKYL
jgi:ribosomal protein S18 acetylase RimI-like enzyme